MDPLEALRRTIGDAARPAEDADAIAGVPARFVATPASTLEASAAIRVAAEHDLAIVVRGSGTKQDWGYPPRRLDLVLDTRRLTGVVEHAAGDLIAVVRAGTTVAELQSVLAEKGQQLALDAPLAGATIGGMVAVNTSGPRRMAYGTVRDLIIGVTIVRADGVIARAGGKVVKNVAGYDLSKLMTGSYGTLGLIAECAFRLHPRTPVSVYERRQVSGPDEVGALLSNVAGLPLAFEIDATTDGAWEVAWQARGEVANEAPAWWGQYPWRDGDIGLKLTAALSKVPGLLAAARHAHVRGSIGSGVLYAAMPGDTDTAVVEDLRAAAHAAGGHAVVLTAPQAVRDRLDLWGPVPGLELMRRIKAQFDPGGRFAPGRFAGGI
ncbi:MAG TPA: FAD-binding oxidoreductase [Micromonosporaceae bacterium]|nr:FAD-binding oxidoreductase [Micromonosporaceae bacterium]